MRDSLALGIVLVAITATAALGQTRITRVSAADLRVRAGGEAVQLTLEGAALESITSFRLLSGGRLASGLEVTRSRGRGAASDRLMLDLQATESAQPGTYQLEVVAGRQRIVVPVAITVEELIAATATPSVTEAGQTSVKLKAGDAAQTVLLRGLSLDLVTGAHVRQDDRKIPGIRAEVRPGANPTRRLVDLSAARSAGVPWDQPLDLVVEAPGPRGLTVAYPTPVEVSALGTLPADHDIFARAINNAGVLSGVSASFNSCGGVDGERRFSIALPGLAYSASGPVPRRDFGTTGSQRVAFLEAHSIDPYSGAVSAAAGGRPSASQVMASQRFNPEEFGSTAHPSPIPHTVTAVRMCLENLRAEASWKVTGADEAGGVPHLIITAGFADTRFRARGMPADPTTGATGLDVGMSWGGEIVDGELPDLLLDSPTYQVRLPMEVANGRIRFGSPTVTLAGGGPRWSAAFLGSSVVRGNLEQFAADRMRQIRTEITRAFSAANTRSELASVTWPILQSVGVTEMLGMEKAADGSSRFLYR